MEQTQSAVDLLIKNIILEALERRLREVMDACRLHKRSASYRSLFVRWDEVREQCGLFEPLKETDTLHFDHLQHKPYAIERRGM